MTPRTLLLFILLLFMTGCASNYYNVPRETYEKKVRVLGVAPIMLDADSEIRHPEKAEVLKIVREANRKNEAELVNILKGNGEYFSVRFVDEEADQLFSTVVSRRERRDDAGVVYNKYFYKGDEIKKYIERHNVDAVMLVTVSGIMMNEKVYSNNFTAYLEENYNNLIMTAQILDPDGMVLWEYPNFRQRFITFPTLFALQYPDFEEARANLTDQVKLKFKSIPGVNRAFTQTETSFIKSSKPVSALYNKQFAEMSSFLQYFRNPFDDKKAKQTGNPPPIVKENVSSPMPQAPVAAPPQQTPLAPAAVQGKPVPREFEPVKPLDPGTQLIKEPEIK
ncbi:MAG: hypothetical protein HXX17_09670 [Geobacteraceae bacterium]|nr:hypothetical protein [Geobacteraceae bacterium]